MDLDLTLELDPMGLNRLVQQAYLTSLKGFFNKLWVLGLGWKFK
jgi:hypothetical protein